MARKFSGTAAMATLISLVKRELNKKADKERSVSSVNGGTGDVVVGGRNLYTGTKDFSGDWKNKNSYTQDGEYLGMMVYTHTGTFTGLSQDITLEPGQYTFSAYAKCEAGANIYIYATDTENPRVSNSHISPFAKNFGDIGTEFVRISSTITIKETIKTRIRVEESKGAAGLWVCGYKLERGTVATDWSPAPEDIPTMAQVQSVNGGTGDVTVGGRNYALKSADVATQTYPKGDETIGTQPSCFRDCYRPEMCKSGDIITISYKIKTKDLNFTGSPVARFQGRGYPDGTSFASDDYAMSYNRSKVVDGSFFENLQSGSNEVWHHVSIALTEKQATQEYWRFVFAVSDYGNITSGSITISDLKLERGTVATDWTPAPEDIFNALDSHEKNENNPHNVTASQVGAVPTARTVNSKALDKDIVLSASDVGAAAKNHSHTASQVTGVSRIQTGSYTGTGTFGASSPCRLTLNFEPKFVLIYAASMGALTGDVTDTLGRYSESSTIIAGFGATDAYRESHISGGTYVYHGHVIDHFTWGANSFTWYSTGPDGSTSNCDGTIQLNASGVKYYYIAIG